MADKKLKGGVIGWMTHNTVAANLLMFAILLGGIILGLFQVRQEVFPEFSLDVVSVRVPYPGASPDEVEQGIVLAIEEEVRGLDGVKSVNATAAEGYGAVTVELLLGASPDKVLADVKNAVDGITSFPDDAEEPRVSLLENQRKVINLVIAGDQPLTTLQDLAEDARTELLAHPDITLVELQGIPPNEVSIEISRETLQRYGLTLDEVAMSVRAASVELPAGGVDTERGELLVKVDDRRRTGDAFQDIIVRGTQDGATLRLGDIATIQDSYEENDQASYFEGKRAVQVIAYRVGDETPQAVADAVKAYAAELEATLPPNIEVATLNDDSELLEQRIDLLVSNAAQGLILVLVVLYLFLNVRLAFWTAIGIPISFLGAFALLPGLDITINMISLFAFIIVLGLVVDDAIVVGENIYEKLEQGLKPMEAAVKGAREMAIPVTFAILTTIAAFSPMFFVPGVTGKIFRILPGIVLAVLIFSLVESFLILPSHLGHMTFVERFADRHLKWLDWPSSKVGAGLKWFNERVYEPVLRALVEWRYVLVGASAAVFLLVAGLVGSGFVPATPFPVLEGNRITAAAQLPYGAPLDASERVRRQLEEGARAAMAELGAEDVLVGVYSKVGEGPSAGGPVGGQASSGSHLVTIEMELVGSEKRDVTATQVANAWERAVPTILGLESLTFNANVGPGGEADLNVQLTHPDLDTLVKASSEMEEKIRSYSDLTGVKNSYSAGKPQLTYTLEPMATTLGLTSNEVGRQLRSAFFGAEALREQRGRNEVKVKVRLPRDQRTSEYDLEQLRIRTPGGGFTPLGQVADVTRTTSPTDITREDGQRVIDITALLAEGVDSNQRVTRDLSNNVFPGFQERYPDLEIRFAGSQADLGEAFETLALYYLVALIVIYALLAIPFRSYLQPFVIMGAIPLGFVGAVLGHIALGYSLSMVSAFGIVALSGVVVNDSLVLMDAANNRRREGDDPLTAIIWAGTRRLRPILLTSFTTFFGLLPLIFEQSVQARFIVPMAISLGFGILFATFVILLVVPAGYMILEDLVWAGKQLGKKLLGQEDAEDAEDAPAPAEDGDEDTAPGGLGDARPQPAK
jgi:multidrug efflux pump subunit AcrB